MKREWEAPPKYTTGRTKFIVACDLHIGSKYQENPNAFAELNNLTNDGKTILNGDIFDLACCPKDKVISWSRLMYSFIEQFGENYVMGNHERNGVQYAPLVKKTKDGSYVGFAHGDLISDYNKWQVYRQKPPGASWLGLIFADLLDDLDHLKAMRPLPKQFLFKAYRYCLIYKLSILVVGHFHPEAERRYTIGGKTIIILPAHRINEVWI